MRPERIEEARKYNELYSAGFTYKKIGEMFNVTENVVKGLIRQYQLSDCENAKVFKGNLTKEPLSLSGDFIIVGDVHVPCTDYDFSKLIFPVAKKYNVKNMIVAGDFFMFDNFSLYEHTITPMKWSEERDAGRKLISEWLEWFDNIYIFMGNHDRRLAKWTGGELDEQDIFGMVTTSDKVKVSNYGWCNVESGSVDWMVTHSKNYSVNQLTVASEIANKYQRNIISHHEHHAAIGWDKYKRYVIVNNGGLFDENKFAYVILDTNKMPGMQNAFTRLQNGVATLYSKYPFTAWDEIL